MINDANWCTRRDAIEIRYPSWTLGTTYARRIPSPSPVSPVMSGLPARLDQPTASTDVDRAKISQPTSRIPQP
jgi:hypothetical protein